MFDVIRTRNKEMNRTLIRLGHTTQPKFFFMKVWCWAAYIEGWAEGLLRTCYWIVRKRILKIK